MQMAGEELDSPWRPRRFGLVLIFMASSLGDASQCMRSSNATTCDIAGVGLLSQLEGVLMDKVVLFVR